MVKHPAADRLSVGRFPKPLISLFMSTEKKTSDNDDMKYGPGVGSTATEITGAVKRDTVKTDDKAPDATSAEEKANITAAKEAISPNNDTTTSGSRKS